MASGKKAMVSVTAWSPITLVTPEVFGYLLGSKYFRKGRHGRGNKKATYNL